MGSSAARVGPLVGGDRRAPPCRTCGQRPSSGKKVIAWAQNLKDTQAVELYARLARSQDGSHDIDPAKIRIALEDFIRGTPA